MLELAHYGGLDEEVQFGLLVGLHFEGFDGHALLDSGVAVSEQSQTDVAEFACRCRCRWFGGASRYK